LLALGLSEGSFFNVGVNAIVKDNRPVNLDLRTIKQPLPAIASILHRISGVVLFVGVALLMLALDKSLTSAEGFADMKALFSSALMKLVLWGVISALLYHLVAGIKHLLMDLGIGETLEGGRLGAKLVLAISIILIVIAGVVIW